MDQYVFYDNSRLLSIPGPGALVRLNNCASSKCISDALWMSYNENGLQVARRCAVGLV